jgi:predicted enzyme related to lactoylglutathione lyase
MKIKLTSVYVDDQDKALRFYTEVVGFTKKADFGTVKLTRTGPDHPSMSGSDCLSAGTRHVVPHQEGAGS